MGNHVNKRWFEQKIESAGMSQRTFAKRVDLHHSLVSKTLSGHRHLSLEEAVSFARVLHVSLDEIIANAGIAPEASGAGVSGGDSIQVKGWVDSDLQIHWEAPKGLKVAPAPAGVKKGIQVIKFQTGGTALDAFDGALAYFRTHKDIALDILGRQCIVKTQKDGKSYFAVVNRGYTPGRFNLSRLNGTNLVEDANLESASPIVWLKFQ